MALHSTSLSSLVRPYPALPFDTFPSEANLFSSHHFDFLGESHLDLTHKLFLMYSHRVVMDASYGHNSPRWSDSFLRHCHRCPKRSSFRFSHSGNPFSSLHRAPFLHTYPFTQLYSAIRLANLFCGYAALIYLRYSSPNFPRPWKVPGGLVGIWAMVIPSIAIAIIQLYLSELDVRLRPLYHNESIVVND